MYKCSLSIRGRSSHRKIPSKAQSQSENKMYSVHCTHTYVQCVPSYTNIDENWGLNICRNTDLKVKRYLRHASVSASCSVNHSSKSSTSDFKMFSIKNMIRHEAFFKEMIAFHAVSFLVSFYEVVLVDISPSFRDIFIFLIISFPAKNSEFSHLRAISPLAIHLCDLHLQNIAHLPHTPLQLRQKLMCVSKSL